MDRVRATIIEEMNNLKPFYDEYLRLKTTLDLIDDKVEKKIDMKVEKKEKSKRGPAASIIKITGMMPIMTRMKYRLNEGDEFKDRHQFKDATGITSSTICNWANKKWIEYIKK